VVAAGLSFITNFFLRAYHLSDTSEAAILGIDRIKGLKHESVADDGTHMTRLNSTSEGDDGALGAQPSQYGVAT
jgi:hypothetical protein